MATDKRRERIAIWGGVVASIALIAGMVVCYYDAQFGMFMIGAAAAGHYLNVMLTEVCFRDR